MAELCTAKRLLGYQVYLSFSPEWFYSYYAINNFADCKVYVCHQTEKGETRTIYDTNLFEYKPEFTSEPITTISMQHRLLMEWRMLY